MILKPDFPPSSAAETNYFFHSCDTEPFGLHLNLNVLLSLFEWSLHQIDDPPEALLQPHAGGGWAGLDEPGPALAQSSQIQCHTKSLWALSALEVLFVGKDHERDSFETLMPQDLKVEKKANKKTSTCVQNILVNWFIVFNQYLSSIEQLNTYTAHCNVVLNRDKGIYYVCEQLLFCSVWHAVLVHKQMTDKKNCCNEIWFSYS